MTDTMNPEVIAMLAPELAAAAVEWRQAAKEARAGNLPRCSRLYNRLALRREREIVRMADALIEAGIAA